MIVARKSIALFVASALVLGTAVASSQPAPEEKRAEGKEEKKPLADKKSDAKAKMVCVGKVELAMDLMPTNLMLNVKVGDAMAQVHGADYKGKTAFKDLVGKIVAIEGVPCAHSEVAMGNAIGAKPRGIPFVRFPTAKVTLIDDDNAKTFPKGDEASLAGKIVAGSFKADGDDYRFVLDNHDPIQVSGKADEATRKKIEKAESVTVIGSVKTDMDKDTFKVALRLEAKSVEPK